MNFKYLGVELTNEEALQSEVKYQAYKASRLPGHNMAE
jgi:hypothetical protein